MNVKTLTDIKLMEAAGKLAAEALIYTGKHVKAGITTDELDQIANEYILSRGAISACIGYEGYPKFTCISVNEVVCHGLPTGRKLKNFDIVNIDITVLKDGFHGDTSTMFHVGSPSERGTKLCEAAFAAMNKGIEAAKAGNTTGDIGFAVEKSASRSGFYVVREIGGHGIGRIFHDDPWIPSFGKKGKGAKLHKWGTITVEPILNETAAPIDEFDIKGSTVQEFRTSDGAWSAQYEHTILITDGKAQILTQA